MGEGFEGLGGVREDLSFMERMDDDMEVREGCAGFKPEACAGRLEEIGVEVRVVVVDRVEKVGVEVGGMALVTADRFITAGESFG